jgi:hypothetical protein
VAGVFVSLVLDAVRGCGSAAKLTLVALADRAPCGKLTPPEDLGVARPSLADIAARTDREERQVRSDIGVLLEQGWITVEGDRKGGRNRPTRYRLNIPAMLDDLSITKAAEHCRVLAKIPGIVPPGFIPRALLGNPAVATPKPGSRSAKPGSPTLETRQSTAAEPVLTELLQPGLEPRDAPAHTRVTGPTPIAQHLPFKKRGVKSEPDDDELQRLRDEAAVRAKLPVAEQIQIAAARLASAKR